MSNIYSLPDGKPLNTDARKSVGNALTGPNPVPVPKTAKEAREQAIARLNKFAIQAKTSDELKYDKPFTFNADVNGNNFERYYAHPKFKQLGFSPFRDNETTYNQNSSLWDDVSRARKQWLPLAGLAVSGTFGNWDDLLSGKPDVDNAIEMERYMNIGSSSREGFGAKALNFGVNTAYTVGVMGSILAEEAVLAGIGATGIGSGVAAAGTLRNTLRLGKAFDRLADVFKTGSNIAEARKTWEAVGKVSKAILPFQNTTDLFRTAERTKMGWDKMDDFAKAYHSFGAFYRDLREINLVTSEAKLEGGFVQNEVANELIKQFREKEGRDPNDKESADIYKQALKAGFSTSYSNMAGIYASNKVVLDKMLKGIPALAPVEHVASKSVRGSIIKNADWLKTGKNPYEVLYGMKKFANKEWLAKTVMNAPKSGLRYMTANLMEGTQELYQEATAEAMKKYYIDTFNDPSRAHQGYMMESIQHGLRSQMSGQGLETFLSGALMAGPMQVAGLALTKGGDYANMLNLKRQEKAFSSDPKNAGKENPYTKKLNEYKEWDTKVVNALNDVTKNKKEYFSKLYRNTKEQKDLGSLFEDAVLNEDTKTAIDSKDDSLFAHIKTLRKSGTLNLFKDELKSLSELSNTELAEAFNEKDGSNPVDKKNIGERINSVLGRIDEIDNHLTNVEKIANIYDPKKDFFKWFAFEEARDLVAYNDYSYKRVGERMISIQEDIKNAMSSVKLDPMYADIAPIFNVGRGGNIMMGAAENYGMQSEVEILTKEIENLQGATEPDLIRRREELVAKKEGLSELSVAVQNAVVAYKLLKNTNATQEEQDEYAERVSEAEQLLYDSFKKYLQSVSPKNVAGEPALFDSTTDELFSKYKDYWKLSSDQAYLANAINTLYNPEIFGQAVDRLSEAAAEADRVKAEQAKTMAIEFQKRYATNDFLNDLLSKFNVFVSEEDAEAYLANNIVPSKFINADTGYELDPRANKEKFDSILDLIDQYDQIFFERTGERLFKPATYDVGQRVAGSIGEKEIAEFVPSFDENDKRTLSDLAKEFGFNKGRTSSDIKVDTALNAIINSKYATPAQKELARKLISLTDKTDLITFKQDHYTNATYDSTNGIIVDARYSSKDYDAKVSVPIEYSILNGVMQKVITDALADPAYASQISELRRLASAATASETEKALFNYGLANDKQFVSELLTNGDFQAFLQNIKYQGDATEISNEAKSMWGKFLDILNDIFKDVLKLSETVYAEAMTVTLNKLAQPKTGGTTTGQQPTTTPGGGTSVDTDAQDAELMQKLRDKYDSIIAGMSDADKAGMVFDSWRKTDSRAIDIIKKHKADKIRSQAGGPGAGSSQVFVDAATKRRALTAVGYTFDQINGMSEDEINDLYSRREELAKGFVPNLNSEDWGEIDEVMNAAKKRVADMNLKLTEDRKNYVQYDENDQPIEGTERKRVSSVVKEPLTDSKPVASARGNIIDGLFKDFLQGKLQSFDAFKERYKELQALPKNKVVNFSEEMLEDLFDSVRTVQKALNSKGIKVISDFPIISGMLGSEAVAGEMDIIAYNKSGKLFIIDIKSAFANRRLGYDVDNALRLALGDKYSQFSKAMKENDNLIRKTMETFSDPADKALIENAVKEVLEKYPNEESDFLEGKDITVPIYYPISDRAQQLAYKELLRQSTGLEADFINIFPITTDYAKAGTINGARMLPEIVGVKTDEDGNKVLLESNNYSIRVDTSKSIYELGIPGVTQTVTTYPENPIAKKAPQQPAASAPVSDIETEKQKITPDEFKEVVRLAKFFLENPSEPGVKGDARSRYPELFKAVTEIERGRQEELKETTKTIDNTLNLLTEAKQYGKTPSEAIDGIYEFAEKDGRKYTVGDSSLGIGRQVNFSFTERELEIIDELNKLPAEDFSKPLEDIISFWEQRKEKYLQNRGNKNKAGVINTKYDAKLAALEGKQTQQQGSSSQTRTYDNKPIAKGLKGKVIYITPDSYTTGDMKTHSEDLVAGDELINGIILGLNQEELLSKLRNLSQGSGKLANAAAGLANFINTKGISENTLAGKNNFKYLLAVLQRNGENTIATEIYTKALSEARKLANEGKTVVFDNTNILKYPNSIDLAILNSDSDIAKSASITPGGKTSIGFEENAYQGTKKRVFAPSAESIITGGAVSKTPAKLKDLRASVNKIVSKSELVTFKDFMKLLNSQGILEDLLADQGLTKESFDALVAQKESQLSSQLSISDLVDREGETLVKFLNKKGEERIGLVIGKTDDNKLEIKDITKEYTELNRGDLLVDVDDLSYAGLGSKAKSSKLAERDVNERVLSIIESEKVDKPEKVTKAQSNTTQSNADAEREAQKDNLKDFDPFDKTARKNNNDDFLSC